MARKRKKSQYHKFEKLKLKNKKSKYSSLRTEYTIDPEKIMTKVWSRTGKTLDQRMLHDLYKIIDEFILEKLIYEKTFSIEGFGTLQLLESDYHGSDTKQLSVSFIPDLKLKEKIKILKKEI